MDDAHPSGPAAGRGILSRAKRLYPVSVCGVVLASNLLHLILWVEDAHQLSSFLVLFNANPAAVEDCECVCRPRKARVIFMKCLHLFRISKEQRKRLQELAP